MYKQYGFVGSIKLLVSYVFTKIGYPQARLIRLPFDIRNSRFIHIGKNFTSGFGCRIEAFPTVKDSGKILILGDNIEINDNVHIAAAEKIIIGNNVLIASKVFISDINHGKYSGNNHDSPLISPNKRKLSTKPICIEDNVWIGEGVCIMAGVTIGFGSVIGALSVVTKNIGPNLIALGSPAKPIKEFDFDQNRWINLK